MGGVTYGRDFPGINATGRFCEIKANLYTGGSWITKGKERLALNYSWRKKMKTSWRTNGQNLAATTIHQFYMVTASFCPRIRSFTDYVFLPWKEFVYLRGPQAVRLIDVSLIIEVLCKISFVSFVYYYYLPENAAYSPSQRSCFRSIERQLKVHREGSIRGKFECFVSKT